MQLTHHLIPEHLLIGVSVSDKYELLDLLVDTVCTSPIMTRANLKSDTVRQAVRTREHERSTALGHGIALPHARLPQFKGVGLAIATLREPLDFGDGEMVSIACLVLAPQERPTVFLKVLSQLTRCFGTGICQQFIDAPSQSAAWQLLCDSNLSLDIPICARDIMEPPGEAVDGDMPLTQVTQVMFKNHLEAIPVVNDQRRIEGEITCNRLFRFGLPDFFRQLKSVSFIPEFDPFEKYFSAESRAQARDVMLPDVALHPPESTLLEVVFDLAVKHYPQVYVIDAAGCWIGSINRSTVLNNVINF